MLDKMEVDSVRVRVRVRARARARSVIYTKEGQNCCIGVVVCCLA